MRGIRLPIIPVGGLNAWSCTLFRTFCSSKINSNNTKEAVPQSSYNDAYRQLQNLDFMTAAKFLFTSPPKEKKFGNVVSTVNLDCKVDLKAVALHARNAEYNPRRFAAVIMRIREPKTTALIFASGKMVCTGAKTEEQSKLAARKFARVVQKLGYPAKFKDFKIQNIVGSCDVKFPIRLELLEYSDHSAFISYNAEIFPGLMYRMKQPKIVLLVFQSGKIVLTGAKVREEIYTAFQNIYPVLAEFRIPRYEGEQ